MKKFLGLMTFLLVIMGGGMILSGCDDELNEILAPADTWEILPIKGTGESSEKNIAYIGMYWSENEKTVNSNTIGGGLTLIVWPDATNSSSGYQGITANCYALKTFKNNENLSFDDEDAKNDTSIDNSKFTGFGKMNRTSWGVIYQFTKSKLIKNETPAPMSFGGGGYNVSSWDTIKGQFSWKRILANYLLQ